MTPLAALDGLEWPVLRFALSDAVPECDSRGRRGHGTIAFESGKWATTMMISCSGRSAAAHFARILACAGTALALAFGLASADALAEEGRGGY